MMPSSISLVALKAFCLVLFIVAAVQLFCFGATSFAFGMRELDRLSMMMAALCAILGLVCLYWTLPIAKQFHAWLYYCCAIQELHYELSHLMMRHKQTPTNVFTSELSVYYVYASMGGFNLEFSSLDEDYILFLDRRGLKYLPDEMHETSIDKVYELTVLMRDERKRIECVAV